MKGHTQKDAGGDESCVSRSDSAKDFSQHSSSGDDEPISELQKLKFKKEISTLRWFLEEDCE